MACCSNGDSVTFLKNIDIFGLFVLRAINLVGIQLQTLLFGQQLKLVSFYDCSLAERLQSNSSLLLCVVQGSARDLEESTHRNEVSPTLVLSFPGPFPHCLMALQVLQTLSFSSSGQKGCRFSSERFRCHMVPALHALRLDFILIGNPI